MESAFKPSPLPKHLLILKYVLKNLSFVYLVNVCIKYVRDALLLTLSREYIESHMANRREHVKIRNGKKMIKQEHMTSFVIVQ